MSEFIVKSRFFTNKYVFFEEEREISDSEKVDTVVIRGHAQPLHTFRNKKAKCTLQKTLISDISVAPQELWNQISKTVRNEIRRAEREGVVCRVYDSENIHEELLKEFNKMFHGMYVEKGNHNAHLPMNEIKSYMENNAFVISVAVVDEVISVYHSYVVDNYNARLLHSCSEFRNVDSNKRNAIGRANKYLHWCDMQYLNNCGKKMYDWGGIFSYDNPNGIDKFKIAFGGKLKEYYNVISHQTLRSIIGHAVLDGIRKIR